MTARDHPRRRLMIAARRSHRWAAWIEGEDLIEFHLESETEQPRAGDIHLGRIVRVDRRLDAAFVDIGREQAAFLPLSEVAVPAVEGAKLIVQIEREGRRDKGPRATARPALLGVRLVLQPGRRNNSVSERIADKAERSRLSALMSSLAETGEAFMARTSAADADSSWLRDEAAALRATWQELLDLERSRRAPALLYRQPSIDIRLLRDHGWKFDEVVYDDRRVADAASIWSRTALPELTTRIAYRRGVEWRPALAEILEQVEDAIQPRIALRSGGNLIIEPTEAMTTIDVNADSAGATQMQMDARGERALLQINLAAVDEIARQIRLRNIGGIAVIDFIDMKDIRARRQIVDRLRAASARDSVTVWVGTMSRLGLVELTRKRRGPTLADVMLRTCSACDGTGFVSRSDNQLI